MNLKSKNKLLKPEYAKIKIYITIYIYIYAHIYIGTSKV